MALLETLSEAGIDVSPAIGSISKRSLDRGAYLFRQGEVNRNLFQISDGLIKLAYLKLDGTYYTKSFIGEGEVFASLTCTLTGMPSRFAAICLTSVEIEQIPSRTIGELSTRDPAMVNFTKSIFQKLALRNEEREYDFLCLTAAERYEKFLRSAPDIARRLTQTEIAAYLGITPVALSRIRARRASMR